MDTGKVALITIRNDFKRTEKEAQAIENLVSLYKDRYGYDVVTEDSKTIVYKMTPK
jgi:hypothetical protein